MANDVLHIAAFGFRALHGIDGGIETHARELYTRLANLGFRITVLSRTPFDKGPTRLNPSGTTVIGLTSKPLYAPTKKGLEAFTHSAIAAAYCVCRRPDIVHVHGIGPSLFIPFLRLFGLNVVMTHHGPDYDATKWGVIARAALRVGERFGVRSASVVICVSNYIRDLIFRKYGVDAHTIYNGLPSSRAIRPPADPKLRALDEIRYVLMVGRLTPHKRIEDVIEASADHGLQLVVCGSVDDHDPYVQDLLKLSEEKGHLNLLGFVHPEDLPWVYANALCTVMASSYEGMPLAVLEAIAYGSPTLLSRIPAHEELALPAERYFDPGDVSGIRACIQQLMKNSAEVCVVESTIDERFDWDAIAGQTCSVMLKIDSFTEVATKASR